MLGLMLPMACGGTPAAPPAAPAASAPAAAPAAPASAQSAAATPETPPPAVSTSAPDDDALKPTRQPREIVTLADTLFLLAFESSEAGKAAEKKCAETASQTPGAEAACMAAARDKILVNAMRFKQDAAKNWWWSSLQKKGNALALLHRVMFDFGDETERTLVLNLKGADQGMAKWAKVPRELRIEVLNDYTIAVTDPQFGKLLYEAKIGLEGR
jgi:hypothetical protein